MKVIKCAGVAFVTLLSFASSGPALALPTTSTYYEYYNDADMTEYAGTRIITCGGHVYSDGVITPYKLLIDSTVCEPAVEICYDYYVNGLQICI